MLIIPILQQDFWIKKYSDEENNDNEFKKLLPNDSKEFLFCGFVDFKRGINSNRGFNIKLEIQQNELIKQKKEIEEMKVMFLNQMEKQRQEFEEQIKILKEEMKKQGEDIKNSSNKKIKISTKTRKFMGFRIIRKNYGKRNYARFISLKNK